MVITKKMDMPIAGKIFHGFVMHEYDWTVFRDCYMSNYVPKCLGCKQVIIDTYIQALGGHYHKNCFVCQVD